MIAQTMKIVTVTLALLPMVASGQDHSPGENNAPYAGFQQRGIKSLSEQDIEELRRGGGWGLALPAELNGRPGPAHLLDLKDELGLSSEQVHRISLMYEEMRAAAVIAGARFISAEAALNEAFASSDLEDKTLRELLAESAQARAELRFIHLSRHLATPDFLSKAQIKKYQVLRGYTDDPCVQVPDGHDPDMWRRHKGCE